MKLPILDAVVRFDRSKVRAVTAVRCTLGFSTPLLLAAAFGKPALGVLAALGALYAGLASYRGSYPYRLRVMATTSVMIATLTFIGCNLSGHPAIAPAIVGLLALIFAGASVASQAASTLAIQGAAVLVVISGIPATAAAPLSNAGLVLAGGLFQTGLLLAFWPFFGRRPERRAVADAFASLAEYLRTATHDADTSGPSAEQIDTIPDRAPFQEAAEIVDESHSPTPQEDLGAILLDAEAIRAALVGYERAYRRSTPSEAEAQATQALGAKLDVIADAIRHGSPLPEFDFTGELPATPEPLSDHNPTAWRRLVQRLLSETTLPRSAPSRPPTPLRKHASAYATLFSVLLRPDLRAMSERHAIRYALAVGAADWLSHLWKAGHAYWLPLTVCIVLRSDYASTVSRGLARVAGTLIGVGIAETLISAWHPGAPILIGGTILGGILACVVFQANYMLFAAAITVYVIASVSAASPHAPHAGMERLTATAAGAVFAILVNFLIPIWNSREIENVLRDAIRAQYEFAKLVMESTSAEEKPNVTSQRQLARSLHIEAKRVVAGAEYEPRWSRTPSTIRPDEILTALDRNAAVFLALHALKTADGSGNFRSSQLWAEARQAVARLEDLLGF